MQHRFGRHLLDLETFELHREGVRVPVQRKIFDLLSYLIRHRDRTVTREELMSALWPNEHVTESSLAWCVSQARKALGRETPSPIETLHGRGYRFRADVETVNARSPVAPVPSPTPVEEAPPWGREAALARLTDALVAARTNRGRLLLLVGEAGIGKTRCARATNGRAEQLGFVTAWGRAPEAQGAPPLWPWIEVLRELDATPALHEAHGTEIAALLEALGPRADGDGSDTPEARFWATDAIRRVLLAAARTRPLLVVLDDLHRADGLTLRALELLSGSLDRAPITLIGTTRVVDAESSAWSALFRRAERLSLHGLEAADVALWVGARLGRPADRAVADALHHRTGGNPLFVEELLHALGDGPLTAQAVMAVELPALVRDAIRRHLGRVSHGARETLEAGSVLGESFDLALLAAILKLDPDDLLERLDESLEQALIVERPPSGSYAFRHSVLQETLRDDLPAARRTALHRAAGEALAARPLSDPGRVAYHLHAALPATEPLRVAQACLAAARDARRLHAHEDVARLCRWGLAALDLDAAPPLPLRLDLMLNLAGALQALGALRDARSLAERAAELADRHGLGIPLVNAARILRPTVAWRTTADPRASRALERALELLPESATSERVTALATLAGLPPHSVVPDKSAALAAEALALARPLGGRALRQALRAGVFSLLGPDRTDQLLELIEEIVRVDEDPRMLTLDVTYLKVQVHWLRGEIAGVEAALEQIGALARRHRSAEALWNHDRLKAQLAFARGAFDDAQAAWLELSQRAESLGLWYARALMPTHLAMLSHVRMGRSPLAALGGAVDDLWESAREAPRRRAFITMLLAEGGDVEGARFRMDSLLAQGIQGLPRDVETLGTLVALATAAIHLGDRERVRALRDALSPYPTFSTPDVYGFDLGCVAYTLGLASEALGERELAVEQHRLGLARHRAFGFAPRVAQSLLALARLDGPAHAAEAIALADRLGLEHVREAAAEVVRRAGSA